MDYPDMPNSMQISHQEVETSVAGRIDQRQSGMNENKYGDIYIIYNLGIFNKSMFAHYSLYLVRPTGIF